MATIDPAALLERLLKEPHESEWLEFKVSYADTEKLGTYVSALANGAMLADRDRGFLVFGVENLTREKVGTTIKLKSLKHGGVNFENWLTTLLEPRLNVEIIDFVYEDLNFSILCIEATYDRPVRFKGVEYVRVGENTKNSVIFQTRKELYGWRPDVENLSTQ